MKNTIVKKSRCRAGFTLVELMVVIVILGILAGLVSKKVIQHIAKAKVVAARTEIAEFEDAIELYFIDTGQYPERLEDLITQPPEVEGYAVDGYLKNLKEDPWGNDYEYYITGEPGSPFEIRSYGADGQEGGEGEDADITNIPEEIGEDE